MNEKTTLTSDQIMIRLQMQVKKGRNPEEVIQEWIDSGKIDGLMADWLKLYFASIDFYKNHFFFM